jgi:O-antigen/teichoic acid export membrane protein
MFIVLTAFFRMGTKIGIFTILNLSLNVFSFGLIMLFVLYGYALTGILVATIIGLIAINIVALVIIFKQIGFQRPRFSNMKSYLKWGIPLTPNSAIMWIIQASDRYIIVYFLGVSAAGIYNVASSIGSYASFTLLPIAMVLYPIISKTYDEKNLEECSNYFKYSFKYLMMVTIPAAVGLSILAKPLLQILTSAEFISGSSVVVITAFGALFNCLQQICSYVMHLSGKTHVNLILLSIAAALNIIFNIILIPHLGIFGAGISYFLSYVVLGLLTLMVTSRYLKFELSLLFLIKSLVASAIMALCIWLLKPESLTMVGLSVVAGIAVYFVILIIIRGFNKTELAFFVSFIKKVNSV